MNPSLELDALRVRVQEALDGQHERHRAQLAPLGPDMEPLLEAVGALLAGGKRLRAAFLYTGYLAAGGLDSPGLIRAAASMEVFQAAALLHDDVMDHSLVRRGMPAAHVALARLHERAGWGGDAGDFGVAGAILAGDLCLTWTDELFATCGLPVQEVGRARTQFDLMRSQLMGGQFLDVLESVRDWQDLDTAERIERARRVIRFKSAKYSVEQPLLIGAAAAGADQTTLHALSEYGLHLGEAFQLRDDLLGVFGDPSATGKPAGDDLREGKRTVLMAWALDGSEPAGRERALALFGRPDLDDADVDWLRGWCERTGAVERVEELIAHGADAARAALSSVDLDPDGAAMLAHLVEVATAREA